MSSQKTDNKTWSAARRLVAGTGAVLAAMVWIQAVAALLRTLGSEGAPLAAVPLTVAAAAVAALGASLLPHRRAVAFAAGAGVLAAAGVELVAPGAWAAALALPAVGALATLGTRWLGSRLPAGVDHALSRRRALALLWALAALTSVVQIGRLAAYETDRGLDFAIATRHPFWYGHECLPAYLHGAELAERGEENLYADRHWPAVNPQVEPVTALDMRVEDPYQYPPQFLLLPALALRLTTDITVLRTVWFALNVSLFAATFAALGLWVGGRAGRTALWLLPVALSAFPMLFDFQFGQFHLAAVALAVLAMLAFARGRRATGGALLATAILAKIFPGVLLVPLLVRRRFRELGWTAAWGAVATVVALAVVGTAPFAAFFDYHLPRLSDGSAFAFDEVWPELADLVVADNQGAFGLARKAGVPKPVAAHIGRAFGLLVLAAGALAGLRLGLGASRWARGATWLALLGAASLTSAGAWGDYVPTAAVWLLALLAAKAFDDRRVAIGLGITAVFQYLLIGTYPIAGWEPPVLMAAVSAIGAVAMLGLFGGVLAAPPRAFAETAVTAPAAGAADPLRRAA